MPVVATMVVTMINTDTVDVYKIDCIIRKNAKQTFILRREICNWLCDFAPTHFISIQFPTNQRSKNMEISRNHLRKVMKYFQKQLNLRHWFKHILHFIGFAEQNTADKWHFHLFLQNNRYHNDKIIRAINQTLEHFDYSKRVINIKTLDRTQCKAYFYATKDIKANKNAHFDDNRVFLSTEMFTRNKKHSKLSQKPFVVGIGPQRVISYKPDTKGATTRQIFDFYKKQPTDTESVGYRRHRIRIYFPNNTRPVAL